VATPFFAVTAPIVYRIDARDSAAHLYRIHLRIAQPQASQQLALPAWIPGSYLLREFAKHLQSLRAEQNGQAVVVQQLDKNTWQMACSPAAPLDVYYEVYAFDPSVRTAWLDNQRGFFNPTSLCLQVIGQTDAAHHLQLVLGQELAKNAINPASAAIKNDANNAGTGYDFVNYDQLADTPFVFASHIWQGQFEAAEIAHEFTIVGAPANVDAQRLLDDCRLICQAQQTFWPSTQPIFSRYVFMLHATESGYGGLEHENSTALICARQDLPQLGQTERSAAYISLLGLISHEYFHSWNVKRLRPADLARYDYSRENYTELLWFFEGFTSYYDDVFLRRTGLIDDAAYLRLLVKNIQALASNPGAQVQSVAQASFDAWTKYYRPDENTVNATVSYYSKGALVALCLDLTLRREGQGTLDAVMRHLWQAQAGQVKAITEADIAAALEAVGGRSFAPELQAWVHGRELLPVQELLAVHGVLAQMQAPTWAQKLGVKVQDGDSSQQRSLKIHSVLRGSCAEAAGLAAGDEWLGVEVAGQTWRLYQLEQLAYLLPPEVQAGQASCALLYSREQTIHRSQMSLMPSMQRMPAPGALQALQVQDPLKVQAWLGPQA
jgi:predicted metalloprotease with PDZ domain